MQTNQGQQISEQRATQDYTKCRLLYTKAALMGEPAPTYIKQNYNILSSTHTTILGVHCQV